MMNSKTALKEMRDAVSDWEDVRGRGENLAETVAAADRMRDAFVAMNGFESPPVMKIYVWDGALAGYYDGLIIAVAANLRAAKDAARKAAPYQGASLEQDLKSAPLVVRVTETMAAQAWTCSGGD